jgi:hypothetical protein
LKHSFDVVVTHQAAPAVAVLIHISLSHQFMAHSISVLASMIDRETASAMKMWTRSEKMLLPSFLVGDLAEKKYS